MLYLMVTLQQNITINLGNKNIIRNVLVKNFISIPKSYVQRFYAYERGLAVSNKKLSVKIDT